MWWRLTGDWPNERPYYVIQDEVEWKRAWADRKLSLNCEIPVNKPACDMTNAPTIDFSSYFVVGIYLGNGGFIDHGSDGVSASRHGSEAVIRFVFLSPNLATASASNSAFYLIDRSFDAISFVPSLPDIS